ncbi:MAG TPA: LssY C-terminal domain-containing protein [Mariprofundaceae bacterium]|nr:LssY C-terminal domain-containing protein [Mariprofundaceae bacterium]
MEKNNPGTAASANSRLSRFLRLALAALATGISIIAIYLLVAYLIMPFFWQEFETLPQARLDSLPKITYNAEGVPGDPLNIVLVGSRTQLVRAMLAIGWQPADPITFKSSIEIVESILLHRPDPDAPVSNLYVFNRKQDLAFEHEVGESANKRWHVRLWQSEPSGLHGIPVWIGSVTFDIGSGLSHRTGQIIHHIDPDIDAMRDRLIESLAKAGLIRSLRATTGIGARRSGLNANGDPYYTDGMMLIGVLVSAMPGANQQ